MKRINHEVRAARLCDCAEGDCVAEVLELFNEAVLATVGVAAAGEVVAAEVVVVGVVGEEVPGDDQDGVADGDGGLLLADPSGEPPELGGEVGVARAGGRPGALVEDLAEPPVALVGLSRTAFAAGDVVAWAQPGPRGKMAGGREPGHVRADLGDDALGGPLADPGDGVELVTGVAKGAITWSTSIVELGDGRLELLERGPSDSRTKSAWWSRSGP